MLRQCLVLNWLSVLFIHLLLLLLLLLFINEWSRKSRLLTWSRCGALSSLLPWKQGRSRWSHWLASCRSRGCLWRRSRGESVSTVTLRELTEKLLSLDLSGERQGHKGQRGSAALHLDRDGTPSRLWLAVDAGLLGTRSMFAGAFWRETHLESCRWRSTVFLSAAVCCVKLTVFHTGFGRRRIPWHGPEAQMPGCLSSFGGPGQSVGGGTPMKNDASWNVVV